MSKQNHKARVLLYDIETGGVNALRADLGFILVFGYKFLGERYAHVITVDQFPGWFSRSHGINDVGILKAALKIMDKADLLVAHYGDKFDRRFLQGRCVIHGLTPPPPTKQRDTWRIARTNFNFSSNRLGNLADTLRLKHRKYDKRNPEEWPGWWFRSMSGDRSAIHAMARYCAEDVQALEELYLAIRKYDNPHPRLYEDRTACRICGGAVQYRGVAFVGENKYRRVQCTRCGKWDRERKALGDIIDSGD